MRQQLDYFQLQKFQGRGFAKLFSAVDLEMEKLKKNFKLNTRQNYSALKAYQNSKFKISKTELVSQWLSIKLIK